MGRGSFHSNSQSDRLTLRDTHGRFCLTLDLKDDPKLIAEYRRYH